MFAFGYDYAFIIVMVLFFVRGPSHGWLGVMIILFMLCFFVSVPPHGWLGVLIIECVCV